MVTALSTISTDPYLELVLSFPLRPIRTRHAHQRAKAMLRSLAGKRGSAVRDYKTVLVSLIADYERSSNIGFDTSDVTAEEIIMHFLEEHEMSVSALSKLLGISQSSLSDMLNKRRAWSKSAIIALSSHFGLQPGLFLKR